MIFTGELMGSLIRSYEKSERYECEEVIVKYILYLIK